MPGIIDYIHGEEGVVQSVTIERDAQGKCFRVLRMSGNPFRSDVLDYGQDIRVDPALRPGDKACYLRLDQTCGLWLRASDRYGPHVTRAIERYVFPDDGAAGETAEPLTRAAQPEPIEAAIFLSHSSWNKLFTRFVKKDLERFARVTSWIDEEHTADRGPGPNVPRERLESWLKGAIDRAKGIVVLWTAACQASDWVQRECEWAVERAATVPLVVIACDGSEIPASVAKRAHVTTVEGCWYAHGLGEEVFSFLHGFEPRSKWMAENERRGHPMLPDPPSKCMSNDDIAPHEGTAVDDLQWSIDPGGLRWSFGLQERDTGRVTRISGPVKTTNGERTSTTAVDFGIRKGCRVARLASYRTNPGAWSATYYRLVWMRIDEPGLGLEWVASCHRAQSEIASKLDEYQPWSMDRYDIELPEWFDPDAIAATVRYSTPDAILDTAKLLVIQGVKLWPRAGGRGREFDPANYSWLDFKALASRRHDSDVTTMLEEGLTWAPYGVVSERHSPYIAPFTSMPGPY